MNEWGVEAQRIGREAELRVNNIAQFLGCDVQTSPELDYGGKTDLLINGVPIQVSCQPKSRQAQERLMSRGIFNICAGERYSDEEVAMQLYRIFTEP